MLLILCARAVISSSRRRLPVAVLTALLVGSFVAGALDQQRAKDNPRQYNFHAALDAIRHRAGPSDTLLYAPNYLSDVVEYYAPGVRARVLGSGKLQLPRRGKVFVLASFLDQPGVASEVGSAKYTLDHSRLHLAYTDHLEKISVWEYR
jgi:hypothetical protein